jgi:parallel beta-helix repeat protein
LDRNPSWLYKTLVVGVIVLFIGVGIQPAIAINNPNKPINSGNTLYVGGYGQNNYTTIGDAIANSSDGDSIYVYSGIYNEWIRLKKQLIIKGIKEPGKDFPIINGGNDHDTVIIKADGCYFGDFKVRNGEGGFLEKGITLRSDNNVINNCEIYHTGWGIKLQSSCNNTISNNILYNGHVGFQISSSNNNTFFNNRLDDHNNHEVEFDGHSENNIFINNTLTNCGAEEGLEIVNSDNNIFIGNNISYNCRGLVITGSSNITLKNNVFWKDGIVITGTIEQQSSHTIENNLVNGKPLYYYARKTGIIVPEDAGQIILINCSYFTIKNCDIRKVDFGIRLIVSSYNIITGNIISSTSPGGIYLSRSSNNIISNNTFSRSRTNIHLAKSDKNIISDNIIENNPLYDGICLSSSDNNNISNNFVNSSRYGIHLHSNSVNNLISRNHVTNCEIFGITLTGSDNIVSFNEVRSILRDGIEISGTSHTVKGNYVSNCRGSGIELGATNLCNISNNIVTKNLIGIAVGGSLRNKIYRNNITYNLLKGLKLSSSFLIDVQENNFIRNLKNAYFENIFPFFFTNNWIGNYWDKNIGIFTHALRGRMVVVIPLFSPYQLPFIMFFPWINFDFQPAKEPYDISV